MNKDDSSRVTSLNDLGEGFIDWGYSAAGWVALHEHAGGISVSLAEYQSTIPFSEILANAIN